MVTSDADIFIALLVVDYGDRKKFLSDNFTLGSVAFLLLATINITIQDNNNSHKNSSFNKDIKQKQKYEELFFDKLKSTKENSKIYIYSKIKTEYEMNN